MTPTRFDTAASKFAPIGIYRPLKPRTDRTKEIYPAEKQPGNKTARFLVFRTLMITPNATKNTECANRRYALSLRDKRL